MEALEAEENIAIDDLPNFRSVGSTQFDVEQVAAAAPDDSATTWDDSVAHYEMPDVIRSFIVFFQKQMRDGQVNEVHAIYENSFHKLTDRYYKSSPWPPAEAISPLVDGDGQFLLLYKELYYRHIYSKMQPTFEQRLESWANYVAIFDLLLAGNSPVALSLPNQWLWDMIDEFIYQFQVFCQYRSRVKNKTEEEVAKLREAPADTWSVHKVLHYLQALVDKSEIKPHLRGEKASSPYLDSPLYKMLGYFSLVGLLRVHCLLADYHLALKCIDGIDLGRKGPSPHGLFTRVTLCHITLFYYVGWSYLMLRRYSDAIKTFSNILFYIARTKQYHTRSYQYEHILKKNEQMYALLAVAASLSPQPLDENLITTLRDKYGDRMSRMQSNNVDMSAYEELFAFACPKFISPAPPPYDDLPATYNPQEAYRLQLRLFSAEVQQQKLLPTIRSYLKLYTTIGIPKLAALAEADEPTFREHLQCLKHKSHQLSSVTGSPLSGSWASAADVDFYVEGEVAHVAGTSLVRKHSDYFVKQINKLEEIISTLK